MNEEEQLAWDILSTPDNADFKNYRRQHRMTWLTKDRKILLIRDMETAHIISCVNMLEALRYIDKLAKNACISTFFYL